MHANNINQRDIVINGVPYFGCRFEAARRVARAIDKLLQDHCEPTLQREYRATHVDLPVMVQGQSCRAFVRLAHKANGVEMVEQLNKLLYMEDQTGKPAKIEAQFSFSSPMSPKGNNVACWREDTIQTCLKQCRLCRNDITKTKDKQAVSI